MNTDYRSNGFTLIELLVSLVLGLLVIAGVSAVFLGGSRNYREDERLARMHDSTRFALSEISHEVEMAGHWSDMFTAPDQIDSSLGGPVDFTASPAPFGGDCGGPTAWVFDTTPAVEVLDNTPDGDAANKAFSCIDKDEIVPGTDIIAIKRVSGAPATILGDGNVYLRTNNVSGLLYAADGPDDDDLDGKPETTVPDPTSTPGTVQDWEYYASIYFIRKYFVTEGDGIPSLCRKVLENAKMVTGDGCLPGIENLQVEVGVDTNDADGVANYFKSAPTAAELEAVVGIRLSMLARTSEALRGYTNPKTYTLGNAPAFEPKDSFPREVTSVVTVLRNPSAARQFIR